MTFERITACECAAAGFCPRHRVHKTDHFVRLCAKSESFFALWENGEGPSIRGTAGDTPAAPQIPARGMGDVVARTLRFTKLDRIAQRATKFFRRKRKGCCGCPQRQKSLNEAVPFSMK